MKPIYTNKGCTTDPQHFRSITVLSCLGKVFTSILSERLTQYSDEFLVLCENQGGFRKGYSTLDNLFILHSLFNILENKKNKLYCAFLEFAKTFDSMWRDGLWNKLLLNNINGNMFNVIVDMYKDRKSRIVYKNSISVFFPSSNGVRHRDTYTLSSLLYFETN